jgi:inner membrane protein involved in colicin E2 resistance
MRDVLRAPNFVTLEKQGVFKSGGVANSNSHRYSSRYAFGENRGGSKAHVRCAGRYKYFSCISHWRNPNASIFLALRLFEVRAVAALGFVGHWNIQKHGAMM